MYVNMIADSEVDVTFEHWKNERTEDVIIFRVENSRIYIDGDVEAEESSGDFRIESYDDGCGWDLCIDDFKDVKSRREFYDYIGDLRCSHCGGIYFYYEEGTEGKQAFKNVYAYIKHHFEPDYLYEMTFSAFANFIWSRVLLNREGTYMIRLINNESKVGYIRNGVIYKEYVDNGPCFGYIFKDEDAFRNSQDAPCYVPEYGEEAYTRKNLIDLCGGSEKVAEELFDSLFWQFPETLLDEWEANGEIEWCDEKSTYYMSYGLTECPLCGEERRKDKEE